MGAEKLNDDRRWKDMELIQSYVFVESEIKVAVLQKIVYCFGDDGDKVLSCAGT